MQLDLVGQVNLSYSGRQKKTLKNKTKQNKNKTKQNKTKQTNINMCLHYNRTRNNLISMLVAFETHK